MEQENYVTLLDHGSPAPETGLSTVIIMDLEHNGQYSLLLCNKLIYVVIITVLHIDIINRTFNNSRNKHSRAFSIYLHTFVDTDRGSIDKKLNPGRDSVETKSF